MEQRCKQEVLDLHQFFQDWFHGTLPNTPEAFKRFASVMDDGFRIVGPGGQMVPIAQLAPGLESAHGSWQNADGKVGDTRIWIKNVTVRPLTDELSLVTYEEWQNKGGPDRGRLSTALLTADAEQPNGVRWLHVHETWLPE